MNAHVKFIVSLFEKPKKVGRPSLNPRAVLNGILWILKSGARWRDLPARYGNRNSLYHKFRQWCECGLFERLLNLVNRNGENSSPLEIDSTFCKVHQSACSGLKAQATGSGGKNTKIHVRINERMQLLNVVLTGGHIHDSQPMFEFCDKVRSFLDKRGAKVCIPDKANFKMKHTFDAELYKQRNKVERFFQRIKNYRHLATLYDKLAFCFLNFVLLASSVIHF